MNRIIVKQGSKGHELVKKMQENKKLMQERQAKKMPPKEILDFVNTKTEDTFKLNKGNIDKQSFMLGMISMWAYLKNKNDE